MSISIESDFPVPKRTRGKKSSVRYPFDQLGVGDSFFVPGLLAAYSVPSAAREYVHRNQHLGVEFTTRGIENDPAHKTHGVRVWRIR